MPSLRISRSHLAPASPRRFPPAPGGALATAWHDAGEHICPEVSSGQDTGHHARIKQVRHKKAEHLRLATAAQAEPAQPTTRNAKADRADLIGGYL
jgi:hypothetical protein